ncbi:hypothetical protein FBALC1_15662 [Flavobacteriales bacterium ALC-1]|nr:hypothetical protein FBALC1_15662 [Flavobacteriales bacterium ALC-1]
MTDSNLIKGLKNDNKHALKYVYTVNKTAFLNFAKKFPLAEEDIIDIYQDAIIALRENAIKGKIDNITSELKTYLFSIGKYMIYNRLKKQKKIHLVNYDSNLTNDEESFFFDFNTNELSTEQKQLQIAFKSLGQKCKAILTLFYYRGFDLEEIMKELNYTNKDVVKSQKSRCIKSLKTMIYKN